MPLNSQEKGQRAAYCPSVIACKVIMWIKEDFFLYLSNILHFNLNILFHPRKNAIEKSS